MRYALVMLLKHLLDSAYAAETPALAASVDSEEYYINMAVAWLFAEAMGKCPTQAVGYLERCSFRPSSILENIHIRHPVWCRERES